MARDVAPRYASSRLMWKLAAVAVTVGSMAWVLWLLSNAWPELASHRSEIGLMPLLFGLALSLVASYLTFEAFAALVRTLRISGLPRRELAHLHFTAQLLKHLPGRVWGVGYQWAIGSSAGTIGDWLLANMCHMLLATYFALWSAALALGLSLGTGWGMLAVACGGIIYVAGWSLTSSRRIAGWLGRSRGKIWKLAFGIADVFSRTPTSARVRIFLLFAASWSLYYAAWFLNGLAYPPLGPVGGMQLCACYMLAWFVGYMSLLTPSGLGVRELAFAWLAKDFPGDAVALMAVVGRLSLLSVDLTLGLAFAPFAPRRP